jgi:hypothetical protein
MTFADDDPGRGQRQIERAGQLTIDPATLSVNFRSG